MSRHRWIAITMMVLVSGLVGCGSTGKVHTGLSSSRWVRKHGGLDTAPQLRLRLERVAAPILSLVDQPVEVHVLASDSVRPCSTTSAPYALVASILDTVAFSAMHTTAGIP